MGLWGCRHLLSPASGSPGTKWPGSEKPGVLTPCRTTPGAEHDLKLSELLQEGLANLVRGLGLGVGITGP